LRNCLPNFVSWANIFFCSIQITESCRRTPWDKVSITADLPCRSIIRALCTPAPLPVYVGVGLNSEIQTRHRHHRQDLLLSLP
jgi:hypothetical protein